MVRVNWISLFILLGLNVGCATKSAQTFLVENDRIAPLDSSVLYVERQKILQLTATAAHLSDLHEPSESKGGHAGDREILIYAKIYEGKNFVGYRIVSDLIEHMQNDALVAVTNPVFFTETVDRRFTIELKAFEVDATGLSKILRRVKSTDLSSLEGAGYDPGGTLTKGLADITFGVFDILSSVTGRSLDDWIALMGADKVFEHSIQVVPTDIQKQYESLADRYLVVADGGENLLTKPALSSESDISSGVDANVSSLVTTVGASVDEESVLGLKKITALGGYSYLAIQASVK